MDRELLQPLSGFRDYNNPTKDWVIAQLRKVFISFGYQALETPALERQEILLGKLGEENQKLLYLFEDNGERKVGLRYDLTVPLSRFVAANYQSLPLPFKRYEIGPVWRAERPQKGRYRQFTQADVDIVGDNDSVGSEQELLQIITAAGQALGITWQVKVNDRRVVREIFEAINFPEELRTKALIIIDKKDKLESSELLLELKAIGVDEQQLTSLERIFLNEEGWESLADLINLKSEGFISLTRLVQYAKSLGSAATVDLSMVRGLDYYTGTIIECVVPDFASSLVGGGRYDSLVEQLVGTKLPAIGVSLGVDRIADYLENRADQTKSSKTIFMVNLPENAAEVSKWLQELRAKGKNVEQYLDSTASLGTQIKYADKRGYQEIYIPFENEWAEGKIIRKNLATGEQEAVERERI